MSEGTHTWECPGCGVTFPVRSWDITNAICSNCGASLVKDPCDGNPIIRLAYEPCNRPEGHKGDCCHLRSGPCLLISEPCGKPTRNSDSISLLQDHIDEVRSLGTGSEELTRQMERDARPQPLWLSDPIDIEALAALEHNSWIKWMKWMILEIARDWADSDPEGHLRFHRMKCMKRWRRQMDTPYSQLTEKEKESDREAARKKLSHYRRLTRDVKHACLGILGSNKTMTALCSEGADVTGDPYQVSCEECLSRMRGARKRMGYPEDEGVPPEDFWKKRDDYTDPNVMEPREGQIQVMREGDCTQACTCPGKMMTPEEKKVETFVADMMRQVMDQYVGLQMNQGLRFRMETGLKNLLRDLFQGDGLDEIPVIKVTRKADEGMVYLSFHVKDAS